MKKINELNLNPSYDLSSYPLTSRGKVFSSNGGMTMSADTHASKKLQRVNKNYEDEETEEIDDYVDDVNLLKEFALDSILGYGKVLVMGIPGWGDLFALGSLVATIVELRKATRKFTAELTKISGIEPPGIGQDFLEPEGVSSDVLDSNLIQISHRLRNLREFNEEQARLKKPPLKVTEKDLIRLKKMYEDEVCERVKKALIEFIGFADAFFGQKGTAINLGIQAITAVKIPQFVTSQWAKYVTDIENEAKLAHDSFSETDSGRPKKEYGGLLSFFKNAFTTIAGGLLYPPKKVLDLLGNLDLLINPEKLKRLELVTKIFEHYHEVDTNEEFAEEGLFSSPGSSYHSYLKDMDLDSPGMFSGINPVEDVVDVLKDELDEFVKLHGHVLREDYSLIEILQDLEEETEEDLDEISAGGVAGDATPLGTKSDGKPESDKERKDREAAANIYTEDVRNFQAWNHITSGKIK